MMKKIIGLTLALIMVLGMVQIPAGASTVSNDRSYFASFDGLQAGQPFGAYSFANGATAITSKGFSFYADNSNIKTYLARTNGVTNVTIEERSSGNNAVKIATSGAESDVLYAHVFEQSNILSDGDIIHMGFDFKTEDMNYTRNAWLRSQGGWTNQSFFSFSTDGIFSFYGKQICEYKIDTWYNIDIYYDHSDNVYYLFVNDEFMYRCADSNINTEFNFFRLQLGKPTADKPSTIYLDNLGYEFVETSELSSKLPIFYSKFNNKTAGSSMLSSSRFGGNDITGDTTKVTLGDNKTGTVTGYKKTAGDIAAKIVIPSNEEKNVYINVAESVNFEADSYMHYGFEIMFEDYNAQRAFVPTTYPDSGDRYDNWNTLKFQTNGTITSYGDSNVIGTYDLNTWYNVDVYFDCNQWNYYVFINDELKIVTSKDGNYNNDTKFEFMRLWLHKNSTTYVDDFIIDKISATEFESIIPSAPSTNELTAIKNTVDGKKSVYIEAAAPEALSGRIVVALYNGNELVEVIPYNAVDRKYITFTENGNDVKVMWLNGTDGDVTPKVKAIPVSFVAGN